MRSGSHLLAAIVLLIGTCSAQAMSDAPLERGTAIIDPAALRELDGGRLGLARIMMPARSADTPLNNAQLFALPSMAQVAEALDADIAHYVERHKGTSPDESIGVGAGFAFRLFDQALLHSADTRFVLSGIVNRMDRAYVAPENCGEIRLIYRLTRTDAATIGEAAVTPRLPMTLNVVLKAKTDADAITCAGIARRWLAAGSLTATGAELAATLTALGGALESVRPEAVDRIETNLQIAQAPKSTLREFRTDYLMKVFKYDLAAAAFVESPLEDQIDRERLLQDDKLAREFKTWLLEPEHFSELDRGTVLIPEKFLAKSAIAPTPAGFAPSGLMPAYGLVAGEGGKPIFSDDDVVSALENAARRGIALQNIRSVAGFARRLNDVTCAGCHQTRGIGGFHFPGVDWLAAKPSNTTVVPASPHFFGDQVRRRDILAAFRDGKSPDFSKGFAGRPQQRGSTELAGTEYEDGWGAHCYVQRARANENDKSFRSWTCAEGLACEAAAPATRMGMCFVRTR
jgi:hypothetical protein